MFTWTPELEALTLPVRGQGSPIVAKSIPEKKLFALAAQGVANGVVPRPPVADWIARGSGDGSPDDEADLFLIVGNVPAAGKLMDNVIDRWFERYGARGAVEIVTRIGAWLPFKDFPTTMLLNPLLGRVRAHLAHAAGYDEARAYLTEHPDRAALPAWPSHHLLPDERSLFAQAAALSTEKDYPVTYLLASVHSDDEFRSLGGRIAYQCWDRCGVTVARALKEAALPHLVAYTERSTGVVGVARALTAFVSEDAAVALAKYIETKPALPILEAYFKAHRALATHALTPLAASKKKKVRETRCGLASRVTRAGAARARP